MSVHSFPIMFMRSVFKTLVSFLCLVAAFSAAAQPTCPVVRIVPERLPDMTMPRSGHSIFYVNDELTVVGGHTTGFVPTPTAEYLADGEWHPVKMVYSHDNGFSVVMRADSSSTTPHGEVIIGGGHTEPLGIGQTFFLERYIQPTHSFEGFGCLDSRRVLAGASQLGDGCVIISGNHYGEDAIACYDGNSQVHHVKGVVQGRSNPYILPMSDGDAMIISGNDQHDGYLDTIWADRVKGSALRVPLLEKWHPVYTDQPFCSEACSVGDNTYLLAVTDSAGKTAAPVHGQMAVVMVCDTTFSLLPTVCPIPMQSPFGPVFYKGPVIVDRKHRRAYVMGVDSLCHRQYILAIDCDRKPAALTLYYTDSLEHATTTIPVVTPDGDLILAGGIAGDNYKPLSAVWLYHFGIEPRGAGTGLPIWLWVVLGVVMLITFSYFLWIHYKRNHAATSMATPSGPTAHLPDEELMQRICRVIERDNQYLTSRLRLSDIAVELGVSVNTLADCIDRQRHCTFAQLIAEYRVRHAQQLLADHPDMKLSALIAMSGFSSESTFFRSFKAVTGLSPKEWLAQKSP